MTEKPGDQSVGLLLSRDLFFTSKVTGTAGALGLKVQTVLGIPQLMEKLKSSDVQCRCVFIDLALNDLDVANLMSQFPTETRPKVVAFGSHVATARLEGAEAAGCDEVMPRSRFSATLPELLKKYLSADA